MCQCQSSRRGSSREGLCCCAKVMVSQYRYHHMDKASLSIHGVVRVDGWRTRAS